MMNKRNGFTRRAMTNHYLKKEGFDPTFQFRPFKLYIITDEEGSYAITSETESDDVFLSVPNVKNKHQWVLIDSDTGAICFFHDLKNYLSINLVDGIVKVKRSDILNNGLFNFNSDNTIQLRSNVNYCLGYQKVREEEAPKESFFKTLFHDPRHVMEFFDPKTEPPLEAVRYEDVGDTYANKWKYVEVYDLRDLTDNADTIEELTTVNASDNQRIDALQKMIDNNAKLYEIETAYRDEKIKGYEDNWFIKWFLK